MSSPARTASSKVGNQCAGSLPPTGAMPISSEPAPAAAAAAMPSAGLPVLTAAAGNASSPSTSSGHQSTTPKAVLAWTTEGASPMKIR